MRPLKRPLAFEEQQEARPSPRSPLGAKGTLHLQAPWLLRVAIFKRLLGWIFFKGPKFDPNQLKLSGFQFPFYKIRKLNLVISTAPAWQWLYGLWFRFFHPMAFLRTPPRPPTPSAKVHKTHRKGMRTCLLLKRVVDRNHKMENSPYPTLRESSGM